MPLHIFEPRYRLLIRRCIEHQRPFGIVLIRSGNEVGAGAEPYDVGTEAKIVAESPLPDGRSYIVTRGERRFAVESLVADAEPYLMGRVRYLDETDGDRAVDRATVAARLSARTSSPLWPSPKTPVASGRSATSFATQHPAISRTGSPEALAVDAPQHQALLELETASARLEEETRILNRETELLRDSAGTPPRARERPELN